MNQKLRTRIIAIGFAILALLFALLLIAFIYQNFQPISPTTGPDNIQVSKIPSISEVAITPGLETPWAYADSNARYFYSRIIIIGQNDTGQTVNLKLQFIRMQNSQNTYGHGYTAYITYNDVVKTATISFNDPSTKIMAKGFLKDTQSTVNNMAQETYSFNVEIDGLKIKADLSDLNSDFIVKNTLDMTRYISAGKARVEVGSQIFAANAMVDNTYSYDINKQANSSNLKDVKFTTHSIIMWDTKNNFYLVDVSDVFTPNPLYDSHKWLLFKNAETGYVKKSVNCVLNMFSKNGLPDRWTIAIPDINNSKLELKAINTYGDKMKGEITGTVTDNAGKRNIVGSFVYINNK